MASYDLTFEVGQFLDHHLMLKVLDFLEGAKVYAGPEVLQAKLDLLQQTDMSEAASTAFKAAGKGVPAEFKAKCDAAAKTKQGLAKECAALLTLLQDAALVKQLRADKLFTAAYLEENHQVEAGHIEALYRYGKATFQAGLYAEAAEALGAYKQLSTDAELTFSSLWGKLAAEILAGNWDVALEDLSRLREAIEAKTSATPLQQLQFRSWLVHWSLFVFFYHPNAERGRNAIVDLLLNDRYLCAVQTNCPHVLRYLTAAVICNKRRRNVLNQLVKVIQQERGTDPVTKFLECLYVDFDFDQAQKQLLECEKVLEADFFLHGMREEFLENARVFIFETYCRIHQKIDIAMLAKKLNMKSAEDAERWIVNLIRDANLDAKIDSAANHVIMGKKNPSVYQSVIDNTEKLAFRSHMLSNALAQRLTAAGMGTDKMMQGGYGTSKN